MAKTADVVVENFRSTVKHKLGVDYEAVKKVNPRIVYGSISGFGQDGPYEGRAGVDQIAQGMGGLMSITGHPGGGPIRVGIAINDTSAGLLLANGIVLALLDRERTGEGQWVHDLAHRSADLHARLPGGALSHQGRGRRAGRQQPSDRERAPACSRPPTATSTSPRRATTCGQRFCKAADADELCHPSRLRDARSARSKNRTALNARVAEIVKQKPSELLADKLLNKAGVPCGPINTIDKVFADPQVQHLGIATPIDHPKYGAQKVVGQPIHLSRYPQPEKLAAHARTWASTPTRYWRARLRHGSDRGAAREEGGVVSTIRQGAHLALAAVAFSATMACGGRRIPQQADSHRRAGCAGRHHRHRSARARRQNGQSSWVSRWS